MVKDTSQPCKSPLHWAEPKQVTWKTISCSFQYQVNAHSNYFLIWNSSYQIEAVLVTILHSGGTDEKVLRGHRTQERDATMAGLSSQETPRYASVSTA